MESGNNLTLTWEGLNVYVPEAKEGFFSKKKPKCEKMHIVQNVFGIARPGQILAIMGASGAGYISRFYYMLNFFTIFI